MFALEKHANWAACMAYLQQAWPFSGQSMLLRRIVRVLGAQRFYGVAVEAATRTRAQANGTKTTNPMMANR